MVSSPNIAITKWTHGSPADLRSGLLAFVQISYGDLLIDVTARRTDDGRLAISFPERRDSMGRRHSVVRPVDDSARSAIEACIFRAATAVREVEP